MAGKRKIILAAGVLLLIIVLAGTGLWWRHVHKKQLANGAQTVGNHLISLSQSSSADDGGLSVSGAGSANDLGQLGGNQSQSAGGNSGSAGSSDGVDPSTFSQYDKYKDNKDALFGDIKVGSGTALGNNNKASIYYKGWLTNGALVDQSPVSSAGQPQPYAFTEGAHQVIPGMEEAMYGMKAGGTRLLIIPPAVGYGSLGQGAVPPNSVLVFEVQLISVQ